MNRNDYNVIGKESERISQRQIVLSRLRPNKHVSLLTVSVLLLSLFLSVAWVHAEKISIDLVADTVMDRDYPDTNYGKSDTLNLNYGVVGTTPDGHAHYITRQMLLRFDDADLASINEIRKAFS